MRWGTRVSLVLCALAFFALPSATLAKDPPNPHDPCSAAGRDTCNTTGVGFYSQSKYGIRWFGDYRGAVPGQAHTFCIDLGYWYPAPAYRFQESSGAGLRNRGGEIVPVGDLQRIAYAVWAYGRTNDPNRQAAVMLYVHSLMGDARPGEVDPATIKQSLAPLVQAVARDAARFHGPYRIATDLPSELVAGQPTAVKIRVLAASGEAVPNLQLGVSVRGASIAGATRTNADGVATVSITSTGSPDLKLAVRTEPLPSTLPRVFTPTTAAAAVNGQRLVVPASQVVSDDFGAAGGKAKIAVSSAADPAEVVVGQPSRDRVTVTGPVQGTVEVRAYGPFPTAGAIRCDGTAAASSSLAATGPGTQTTEPITLTQPGWYVYQETIAPTATHIGVATPCTDPNERFKVVAQPTVRTLVSSQRVEPGVAITDQIAVAGLAGQQATVDAVLYGPFPSHDAVSCTGTPVWTGSIPVTADGTYTTEPFTTTTPGYYVYHEQIARQDFLRETQTSCSDEAETTVVVAHPKVTTAVSAQKAQVGATITDRVVVSGLGALEAPVKVELWGPAATRGGITCSGRPYWTGTIVAKGDGIYRTAPVRVDRAGYFTYRESIALATATDSFAAPCAEVAETTVVDATPHVTTVASAEVVFPGSKLSDRILVTGLGKTPAAVDVDLFGPFASRSAVRCSGPAFWHGRITANGNGELRSPAVTVAKVGFYVFRERIAGSALVAPTRTECPLAVETGLARPLIITGRNDSTRYVAARGAGATTPRRVRIGSLGIDAPVLPSGIDIRGGILGVTPDIHRTGWWADDAAPGATSGSILIAGHVDSATAGAGAFFKLRQAQTGARVEVLTAGGRTFAYRVVSVRSYLKRNLPVSIYSLHGRPRLVLVTCGGPFDPKMRHYRDNIVVTAVPTG